MIISVNQHNFQKKVLEYQFLVIVNFWVSWNEEREKMRFLMKELDKQSMQTCKVVEINVEAEKELAQKYQVRSVPGLLIFDEGKLIAQHSGMLDPKEFLKEGGLFNLKNC